MKIAVDLDDTLSMVDRAAGAGAYIARKGLPFRLKDPDALKLAEVYDWTEEDALSYVKEGGITLFTDAKARKGAREALTAWRETGHEIVILTARMKEWFTNPALLSRDWLEKRRIPFDDVVAEVPAEEKGRYCARHGISVLVDDNADACLAAQRCGVYAVLALRKSNLSRAEEICFGGSNWAALDAAIRRISEIGTLENSFYRCFPARRQDGYEGWDLRFDDAADAGYNHIRPRAPSALSAEEKIFLCEACYRAEGKKPRFRLTDLDGALDGVLSARGYTEEARGDCFVLRRIPDLGFPAGVKAFEDFRRWREICRALTGERVMRSLTRIDGKCVFLAAFEGETPVAAGMCSLDGEFAWLSDLYVRPDRRGRGYGKRMAAALLSAAGSAGAKIACAQTGTDNAAARTLFRELGFYRKYGYTYKENGAID